MNANATTITHNHYTAELSPALASRFLMTVGIGVPARRATCLAELHQHIVRTFGKGAPERTERIIRDLHQIVLDWYEWMDNTGQQVRKFQP